MTAWTPRPVLLGRRALMAGAATVAAGLGVASGLRPRSAWANAAVLAAGPDADRLAFDIVEATAPLLGEGEPETAVFTYGGTVPGPTLRLPQGRETEIAVTNRLDQPTSVHWHGLRIANAYDGVAGMTQPPIEPGETFVYRLTPPDAGTYWYHPHIRTSEQLARGLYGPLIVTERTEQPFDDDRVFAIDDWRLTDAGRIDTQSFDAMMDRSHAGRLGNVLTVNGRAPTDHPVRPGDRLRLRLINTANARVFTLDIGDLNAQRIAVDGQPVAPKPASRTVVLAPGQRIDLSVEVPEAPGTVLTLAEVGAGDPYTAARLVVEDTPPATRIARRPFEGLPANPLPTLGDFSGAVAVDLAMAGGAMGGAMGGGRIGAGMPGMEGYGAHGTAPDRPLSMREMVALGFVWTFNGVAGMPADPLIDVAPGTPVILRMINDTRWPHAMHLHGHHFQEVTEDGRIAPGTPHRDTLLLDPGETRSVAFVADNPGDWMLHCHMIEHQAGGMATWIRVA